MIPTRNRELSGDSITEILLQDPHRKYVPDREPRRKKPDARYPGRKNPDEKIQGVGVEYIAESYSPVVGCHRRRGLPTNSTLASFSRDSIC